MRRQGYRPPYYDYQGADPSSLYYGVPCTQDGGIMLPRTKTKRSFAEKLSSKLDKLAKPRERDRSFNRAYQEVYRDHYGNIMVPRSASTEWSGDPYAPSPSVPKRTFHNVIHRNRSAPSQGSSAHGPANRTWSGWEGSAAPGYSAHPGGSRSTVSNDYTVYGDVLYEDYHNFAINSNVCMCEDYLGGTQRGKKAKKPCKKCGFDRLGSAQQTMRRSISEESVNGQYTDPYEYMRRKRLANPKPVFYDEQDEYEDIEFQHSTRLRTGNASMRQHKTKPARSRSPNRRSSSPVHKKSTRTQSMIVNNRNQLNTKDNKEMQNIPIRASPMRSASSITKSRTSEPQLRSSVVTVNGCATKNSSIIYLSPDASGPPTPMDALDRPATSRIKVSTESPGLLRSQGSVRVSPYDLIKKYIPDSPNSLSDSNLSSDDPPEKTYPKSEESDFSDSDDMVNDSVNHFTTSNGFKISGQKIQIYSDGSVTATDSVNVRAYSLSGESEEESDKESEYSNYDADCSVVESPRFAAKRTDEDSIPRKPPRRTSVEKEVPAGGSGPVMVDGHHVLDLPGQSAIPRSSPQAPAVSRATGPSGDRAIPAKKSGTDLHKSGAALRSKSFNGSRESLNLFGSVDFNHLGISKNFSSELIQEVYGSKTSLLKQLDLERKQRKEAASVPDLLLTPEAARGAAQICQGENTVPAGVAGLGVRRAGPRPATSGQIMFHDTTRLRMMARPSLKDALQSFSAGGSTKLGRVGVSQSFRDRVPVPVRPRDPPPPPPPSIQATNGEASPSYSLARKFFSFNKTEIRRINKFLGISNPPGDGEMKQQDSHIYDIAENDEGNSESGAIVVNNSTFYTGDAKSAEPEVKKKNTSLRLRPKSNEFCLGEDPVKPPRSKRERSKSFTPRSNPKQKASIFNRSLSHIPKSASSSSIAGKHVSRQDSCKKASISAANDEESNHSKRTLSSSDLVHIFPDEERRSFKDIRKILSSPSISSSASSSTNQIYRPKSQLSNSSSVINSIKEEQVDAQQVPAILSEHIYEEIHDSEQCVAPGQATKRPLPPLPATEKQPSPSRTSPILSDQSSPVKSIFEGASKYDILNYLEDARERGLTDCDLDLDEGEEEEAEFQSAADGAEQEVEADSNLAGRGRGTRGSGSSKASTSGSSSDGEPGLAGGGKDKLSSVDIERNDSGLGSETGRGRGTGGKLVVRKRSADAPEDLTCLDCDLVLEVLEGAELEEEAPLCEACSTRRVERKEIITEIIETEIKYGRDLRIIYEEFYRPMMVAGLLAPDQLANIFLNVEELIQVNAKFTESLKDAIEISLDQGDEDMCTVAIGLLFLAAAPMLGAFKSYCTRQGSASTLLAALERERELLRIFLKVSQMENTILRRMNLSSFLMVPVQRVTRYPLLLSRLLKVSPASHGDRPALQEARAAIEAGLDSMNQETARDSGTTKLWRRISMINPPGYRRSEHPIDLLGSTTWGVRKMVLETLGWGKEPREEVGFVLEHRLLYTQPTETNWRSLFAVRMAPSHALLVTLGAGADPAPAVGVGGSLAFPADTGCREAALVLLKEKGVRYSPAREPLMLDRCVVCWEDEWEDCFEVTEFSTKESYIFKGEDPQQTLLWYNHLKFYCSGLGGWRRRRNGLANIMINGMVRGARGDAGPGARELLGAAS